MFFSEEQIIQLAPDPVSLKAGKDIAASDKWQNYFFNERVLWGEVKGSGREPYRSQIDTQNLAFKCSCPSRKFPCKHGLGLLFLFSKNQELFKENNIEPCWVKEWMDKRSEKVTKPVEIPLNDEEDEKNQIKKAQHKNKRDSERNELVLEGINETKIILKDFVRSGLLSLPEKGRAFFQKTAARMVDAKATGLANRWKSFAEINFGEDSWHETVLEQIAEMYLLALSYEQLKENKESLILPHTTYLLNDIKSFIGFTTDKKELLEDVSYEKIKDNWLILSSSRTQEEDLMIQKNWLYGFSSQRFALILEFKHKTQAFEVYLAKGKLIKAELVFFPSVVPQRAIINHSIGSDMQLETKMPIKYLENWQASYKDFIEIMSQLPWLKEVTQCIWRTRLVKDKNKNWYISDSENKTMQISLSFEKDKIMQLLSISGGSTMSFLFLIRTINHVTPLGFLENGTYWAI